MKKSCLNITKNVGNGIGFETKKYKILREYYKNNDLNGVIKVFGEIKYKNINAYTILMKMYNNYGMYSECLSMFLSDDMKGINNEISFTIALSACKGLKDKNNGYIIYEWIKDRQYNDIKLWTALIDFYGNINDIEICQHIFDSIEIKDDVIYATLMNVYNKNRIYCETLKLYGSFDGNVSISNNLFYIAALDACYWLNNFKLGNNICGYILTQIYCKNNIKLYNKIINYYGLIGNIEQAINVYEMVKDKDIVTHTSMMNAFNENKWYQKCLELYDKISGNIKRQNVCYIVALNSCIQLKNKSKGQDIYKQALFNKVDNLELFNTFIVFFGIINDINECQKIFNSLKNPDIVTYNALMKAYNLNRLYERTIDIFKSPAMVKMKNNVSLNTALDACTCLKNIEIGDQICNDILRNKKWNDIELYNSMIKYYGIIDNMDKCEKIFKRIENKSIITYNIMMSMYNDHKLFSKTLDLYFNIDETIEKSHITYNLGLNVSITLKEFDRGRKICDDIIMKGYDTNIQLASSMIQFYGKINKIKEAETVFHNVEKKDIVMYNAIMSVYNENRMFDKSIQVFKLEKVQDLKNSITYNLGLNACINAKNELFGREICNEILYKKLSDVELYTSILNFYGIINDPNEARKVFDNIEHKTVDVYNTLMNTFKLNGYYDDVLEIFYQIKTPLNAYSYSIVLYCCGQMVSPIDGDKVFHRLEHESDRIKHDAYVQSSLISMLGKFGDITKSFAIFHDATQNDKISYNKHELILLYSSMMDIFTKAGDNIQVLNLFYELKAKYNIDPDINMYCIVINAFTQTGNTNEAMKIFNDLMESTNNLNIYALLSIIDGLSRKNNLSHALSLYTKYSDSIISYKSKVKILTSILNGASIHNNISMAQSIVSMIEQIYDDNNIKNNNCSAYKLLSNVYTKTKIVNSRPQFKHH